MELNVPLFKYLALTGMTLLGLIVGIDLWVGQPPAAPAGSSVSLDVLRAMAHHGENRRAALASAGPLFPVVAPVASVETSAIPASDDRSAKTSEIPSSPVMNAQASMTSPAAAMVKPAISKSSKTTIARRTLAKAITKPAKNRLVARQTTPRTAFADNMPRNAPFDGAGFFRFR